MRTPMLALALAVWSVPAAGQVVDEGTFVVRQAGREIGREDFSIDTGRQGGAPGTSLRTHVRFPSVRPQFECEAILERRPGGEFVAAQFDITGKAGARRILAEASRQVLRIHTAANGSEAIREMPARPDLVILDDSLFALYAAVAELASEGGTRLTGVFPRSGRRTAFLARRVAPGNDSASTRILLSGDLTGTIWMDEDGHVTRLEFPATRLEVQRLRH